tara:strand:+ start:41 stop:199 length:159 start_codon:yes stop_codon:yes gene_type:complete
VKNHIDNKTIDNLRFDLGQENTIEFDNSKNSFVGCCSFGTGHFELFIIFRDN